MQLGGAGAEVFEPTYLRLVGEQLDKVELFGITASDRVTAYPLSVAYVSLSIPGEPGQARRPCSSGWRSARPAASSHRRWRTGTAAPRSSSACAATRAGTCPPRRTLLLIDGVDELPEEQRRAARQRLRELLTPRARYVVTSRPTAAAEDWLGEEAFDALEIQPMTLSDIDAFVTHWHEACRLGVPDAEQDRVVLSRQTLTRTIRNHRHLRILAVNPLMTALICALHLDRRGLYCLVRNGWTDVAHDRIDFVHKTFQEYLSARAAVNADDTGVLASNAHDDHRREVVLTAVGHARPHQTDDLLRAILAKADEALDERRYVLKALAVACVQYAPSVAPDLREELRRRAVHLVPPRNLTHATAVAGAGETALACWLPGAGPPSPPGWPP